MNYYTYDRHGITYHATEFRRNDNQRGDLTDQREVIAHEGRRCLCRILDRMCLRRNASESSERINSKVNHSKAIPSLTLVAPACLRGG